MIYTPGIYQNMPKEHYHADPCVEPSLSRGVIRDIIYKTPAHVKENHPRLNPAFQESTDQKYDKGTAGHSLFLEGVDCCSVVDADDWRTKAAKEARDKARKEGKTPLLREQYDDIKGMVAAAHTQLAMSELGIVHLHEEGESEVTYIWEEDGVWCRARLDWISHDRSIILDPKFTGNSASPFVFDRSIEPMGLDIQYAWYCRAVEKVEGITPDRFVFWVVETEPPYLACPISLNPQYVAMGKEKVETGLAIWKKLLQDGDWPGYPNRICYLEPRAWAIQSWDERRFALEISHQEDMI